MKKITSIKKVFFWSMVFFCLVFFGHFSFAQQQLEKESGEGETIQSEPILIATVELYNAKIVDSQDGLFAISFDLFNKEKIQGQIKYGVKLLQTAQDGKQAQFDSRVFDETLTLGENQTISKTVHYKAPDFLFGKYQMILMSQNEKGIVLAVADLGEIELKQKTPSIQLDPRQCFLSKENEQERYELAQGAPAEEGQSLQIACRAKSSLEKEVSFSSRVISYAGTDFAQNSSFQDLEQKQTLSPKEEKEITFTLPVKGTPGVYENRLILLDDQGQVVSNDLFFRHYIQGTIGQIQNIRADKVQYKQGETAKLFFNWSVQKEKASSGEQFTVEAFLQDEKGAKCSQTASQQKTLKEQGATELALPITADCQNFQIVAQIKDSQGNTLDQSSIGISLPQQENQGMFGTEKQQQASLFTKKLSPVLTVVLAILFLLAVAFALFFFRNKKDNQINQ